MTALMFSVPTGTTGQLWIMPCPRAAQMASDIVQYRAAGVTDVVSMLALDEAQMLGLAQESSACHAAGIAFHSHPIADFGLPDMAVFSDLAQQIVGWLQNGQSIAVHCRAGIGRSGMVTAGVLISLGQSAPDAIETISTARGVSIPDTVEQGNFLTSFAVR